MENINNDDINENVNNETTEEIPETDDSGMEQIYREWEAEDAKSAATLDDGVDAGVEIGDTIGKGIGIGINIGRKLTKDFGKGLRKGIGIGIGIGKGIGGGIATEISKYKDVSPSEETEDTTNKQEEIENDIE